MSEEVGMPKHGEFCWSELATNNLDSSREFYKNVFGWRMEPSKNSGVGEMEYQEFQIGDEYPMGGMYDMKHIFGENQPPPYWVNYIAVDDVDAVAARVESLGGKCCHEAKEIPNVGRMVTIMDPTGAMVTLITLKQM